MAKSKSKRRPKKHKGQSKAAGKGGIAWGGSTARPSDRRWTMALVGLVVVAAAAGGYFFWQSAGVGSEFQALIPQGQAALKQVETHADRGQRHLGTGELHVYGNNQPTSGPHDRTPTDPGFYDEAQPATQLVHGLEHGHIVVYYDKPGAEALAKIKAWANHFGGHWDGVIAVPQSGLGEGVALTAWTKRLWQEKFDPAAAAAFIDAYRGRGPENAVR
jgi:hypothetical protein